MMIVKSLRFLFVPVVLLLMLTAGCSIGNKVSCSHVNSIDASIEVETGNRNAVGLNTDTDSLNFGKASPGATSNKRFVNVKYTADAEVSVFMQGDISTWVMIEPDKFHLVVGGKKEVSFMIRVPSTAEPGNYTGKAVFCFEE